MELILISSPGDKPNEVRSVKRIFEMGLSRFHLRKPDWSLDNLRKYLNEFPDEYLRRIVVHRRRELLKDFPLAGYHLSSREDYSEKDFEGSLSRSFHTLEELKESEEQLDYVFLGPIFDSISKQGYKAAFPPTKLRGYFVERRKARLKRPRIVALGGIVPDKVRVALSLGFDGVAALGGVWGSRYPQKSFMRYLTSVPSRSGEDNQSWIDRMFSMRRSGGKSP